MSATIASEIGRADNFDQHSFRLVAKVVALLDVACGEFGRDQEAARASVTRATFILRSELRRHEATSNTSTGSGELAGWQVQRLRAYIDSHLGGTIHVKDLSGIVRRSTAHFCRTFKRTFGQSPHAYITTRRIEHAKNLMLQSEEQLSVIALLCGFTDQAHLSKLFRQHTGETPGAWRRRRSGDEQRPPARRFSSAEDHLDTTIMPTQ